MNETQRLVEMLAIQALKARYFRMMDSKDWKGLEQTFAPDLVADFRESAGGSDEYMLTYGAAEYVAKLTPFLEHMVTVHHGHMPEIEFDGPDAAIGIWAMEDKLWVRDGAELPFRFLHGYGHYHERYVKIDGAWRIKEITLKRLKVEVE